MISEKGFAEELVERYESDGWKRADPDEARQVINFRPDLVLERGEERLVVELKRAGFVSSRAVSTMRKLVEAQPHWRFELKLIPPDRGNGADKPIGPEIKSRIEAVRSLAAQGFKNEAFILAWTALEAVLRTLLERDGPDHPSPTADLLREAYEDGVISDIELRQLQNGMQIRNRLVHGFSVKDTERDAEELASTMEKLLRRADETHQELHTPGPVAVSQR